MKQKPTKRSRYSEKIPFIYDRGSRSFLAGAWKHWPENRMGVQAKKMEALDRQILKHGRESR